jgi:hypothetical protein
MQAYHTLGRRLLLPTGVEGSEYGHDVVLAAPSKIRCSFGVVAFAKLSMWRIHIRAEQVDEAAAEAKSPEAALVGLADSEAGVEATKRAIVQVALLARCGRPG